MMDWKHTGDNLEGAICQGYERILRLYVPGLDYSTSVLLQEVYEYFMYFVRKIDVRFPPVGVGVSCVFESGCCILYTCLSVLCGRNSPC